MDKTREDLNRIVDYKELKGKDPSAVDLVKKIEQVLDNIMTNVQSLFLICTARP